MFRCPLDGWPSGLRRTPGKRVGVKASREFESRPVRSLSACCAPACRIASMSGRCAVERAGCRFRCRLFESPANYELAINGRRVADADFMVASSGCWYTFTTVAALFHPPRYARSLSGACFISVANFRRSECQPHRTTCGTLALVSSARHHLVRVWRLSGRSGDSTPGKIHASPMPADRARAASSACTASGVRLVRCSNPILSFSARQRIRATVRSTSDHRRSRIAPIRCPVSCARSRRMRHIGWMAGAARRSA